MRSGGNGSSSPASERWNAVTGPISTSRVRRATDQRARRTTFQAAWLVWRWRGLRELEAEALRAQQEAVQEVARKARIVVEDDHPVGAFRGRCLQQRVQVLELPLPGEHLERVSAASGAVGVPSAPSTMLTWWRLRRSSASDLAMLAAPSGA